MDYNKLKIEYKAPNSGIDSALDATLINFLEEQGYGFEGSGVNLKNGVRDLGFKKTTKEKK